MNGGGSFSGDQDNFIIRNASDDVILHARNHLGNGGWSETESELRDDVRALLSSNAQDHPADIADSDNDEGEQPPDTVPQFLLNPLVNPAAAAQQLLLHNNDLILSADERRRAEEAFPLCGLLGHPGDQSIIDALDGNHFPGTHLTSQDFRNARRVFGDCVACIEGKMRADSERPTSTPPPEKIGDVIHGDIYPLKSVSIGGNLFLLILVDAKSGYILGIPMPSKNETSLAAALLKAIRIFNTYGHPVKFVLTDDEVQLGIQVEPCPADLHAKFVENRIGNIKNRIRAVDSSVAYAPIPELECEKVLYCIHWINSMPNVTYSRSHDWVYRCSDS
jgi:hypothetical protein